MEFEATPTATRSAIASLSQVMDQGGLDIHDSHLIDELESFAVHEDGREAALSGKQDEDVMALVAAVQALWATSSHNESLYWCRFPEGVRSPESAQGPWQPISLPGRTLFLQDWMLAGRLAPLRLLIHRRP
jgi:hypothetical protein